MNAVNLLMMAFVLQLIFNIACAYVMIRDLKRYHTKVDSTVQQAITDVASQISENFQAVFETPSVSRAMSVLGKKSGQVRAEQAVLNKFSENLPEIMPSMGFLADKLDMEPLEMVQLMNDPIVGPTIQKFLGKFVPPQQGEQKTSTGAIT